MKRVFLIFMAVLIAGINTAAWAEASKEEARIEKDASALDKDTNKPEGEKMVVQRLEKEFHVDDARINSLRGQKLGYGEIAIVLAMAEKLPGGITDATVNKIMSMRHGPPVEGWGKIAMNLGFKLGPVISKVERVKAEARKDIEKVHREKVEKVEKVEKKEKYEKVEKIERHERPGRKGR
jgi:hypothetical protein